jgi:glycine/D-amino acid oxidase-like deaminating enzyme
MRIDVLIFGGGVAGLWCLDRLRRSGYAALLLECTAVGSGQTIQAQGIIHGGGKYAVRRVRDFAAVHSTREMPERWRRSLAGEIEPDLTGARVLSDRCYLWLPRGSFPARLQSWGFVPVLAKTGLLATRPERIPSCVWPEALRDSAVAVYSLAEPVIATGSVLQAMLKRNHKNIYLYDRSAVRFVGDRVETSQAVFEPRFIVLTAGEGNAELLERAGIQTQLMQRRPLGMVLLKGDLPPLFGHCIVGGKTELTITTPSDGIWQIGGEIAERLAHEANAQAACKIAMGKIRRWLPAQRFEGVEIAIYRAVRAEGRTADLRRPSGVHVSRVAPRLLVAWPTKLSLIPVLADEVFNLLILDLKEPAGYDVPALSGKPTPLVARYPWEDVEWLPAN